jgi:hypothetical protein
MSTANLEGSADGLQLRKAATDDFVVKKRENRGFVATGCHIRRIRGEDIITTHRLWGANPLSIFLFLVCLYFCDQFLQHRFDSPKPLADPNAARWVMFLRIFLTQACCASL